MFRIYYPRMAESIAAVTAPGNGNDSMFYTVYYET